MALSLDTISRFATRRAGWLLVLVAAITFAGAAQIVDPVSGRVRLTVDPSIDAMLPEDDAGRKYYEHIRRLFGNDETVLVALITDDVFSRENLDRVVRMTKRIDALTAVHHVVSLATALDVRSIDGAMEIIPFLESMPTDAEERVALRDRVLANPVFAGSLVSKDGRATVLSVNLRDLPERELVESGLIPDIKRIVSEERGEVSVWVTGGLFAKAETARLMLEDIRRTLPLAIAIAMLVAWASFRSLRGVLIPTATVLIAVVWTLGSIAAMEVPLNLLTVIIPTLLLVVGFAYAIHIVSEYYDVASENSEQARSSAAVVREAMRRVALPVILTGITTAAGFLSLTTSPIQAIRQFGAYNTLGIVFTCLVSLSFAPAVLVMLPLPARIRDRKVGGRFDRASEWLADFDVRNRGPILLVGAAIAIASIIGMLNIRVGSVFVEPGSPLERSAAALDEYMEGANGLYVVLEASYDGAFKEPEKLQQIESLQHWLDEQPEIGGTTSVVDYLMLIRRGFLDGAVRDEIPNSKTLISQLFFFGGSDDLERFVDSRFQTTTIHVRCRVNDTAAMEALLLRIETRMAALPENIEATVTGNSVLLTRTIDDITRGQSKSLALAFGMIFVVLSLLFMSPRIGLLALIPNALPVLFYFGFLGLAGITLNSTTGLVACLVLGIAVDDTIHFLARFNEAARRHADEGRGVADALRSIGRPVTYTTIALCGGFLALTQSHFHNQVQFGALAALTLAFAWLVDVTFTPALASRLKIVSLWDALTVDLGDDPHLSIPLFKGLRKTQARVAALMTNIVDLPSGHRLFSAGDRGDDMYVIIEGQLAPSVVGDDGGTVRFGTLSRGDSVGEVGLFHGYRTADVVAETDVRLLRFTRESLERIRRRYPRTAARLYSNLSDILADRVATTTAQVH
ncbi:MAG: MMPL family transporter [Deltaproteobacteria bacterium]|nr:MMPL family transporter [Deltaproteobacteria bacterium]